MKTPIILAVSALTFSGAEAASLKSKLAAQVQTEAEADAEFYGGFGGACAPAGKVQYSSSGYGQNCGVGGGFCGTGCGGGCHGLGYGGFGFGGYPYGLGHWGGFGLGGHCGGHWGGNCGGYGCGPSCGYGCGWGAPYYNNYGGCNQNYCYTPVAHHVVKNSPFSLNRGLQQSCNTQIGPQIQRGFRNRECIDDSDKCVTNIERICAPETCIVRENNAICGGNFVEDVCSNSINAPTCISDIDKAVPIGCNGAIVSC